MATGRFGAYDLTANTPQSLAQGETDRYTACSVSLCNRGKNPVKVSVAITSSVNIISNAEYIDRDVELLPNCVLERTGIAIKANEFITVSSDTDNVSAVAWGVESGDTISVSAIPTNQAGVNQPMTYTTRTETVGLTTYYYVTGTGLSNTLYLHALETWPRIARYPNAYNTVKNVDGTKTVRVWTV